MADLNDLDQNPELKAWLEGLKKNVAEKSAKSQNRSDGENFIRLPIIDMSKKFRQNNNKTYPEMQGSITILPVPYKGARVTEVTGTLRCWCPANDDWSYGFTYNILPLEFYPEGPVRDRIKIIRSRLESMLKSGQISWKECKRGAVTLILSFVVMHRNTKGDIITSNLYGDDNLIEHKFVPALVVCPSGRVQEAIQTDLDNKVNPAPYAMACYSDAPLADRKGWMAISFKDVSKGFGYDVKVTADILNPVIMPDGIIPSSVNLEDERIQLLYKTDPIFRFLDYKQTNKDTGEYFNDDSLNRLESVLSYWEEGKHKK